MRIKLIYLSTCLLLLTAFKLQAQQKDTTAFVYHKPLFDFDYDKPVFKLAAEQQSNKSGMLRFSVLTGYREGVKPVSGMSGMFNFNVSRDPETGLSRLSMFNLSIIDMLNHDIEPRSHIILEVKNPSKYRYLPEYGSREAWIRKNTYCYEMTGPVGTTTISQANSNLAMLFGVTINTEKRKVKALVLFRTSAEDKLKSAGGKYVNSANGSIRALGLDRLVGDMDTESLMPIVDETGYTGAVDMDLNITDWSDLPAVRKALQRYDLDVKEDTRELEVLVIKEK